MNDVDSGNLFTPTANNEQLEQLRILKEQYLLAKQKLEELDALNNPKKLKTLSTTRDLVESRPQIYEPKPRETIDPTQLQTCIKQVIERHGGGCNINTIISYVQQRWPMVLDDSDAPFGTSDYKKVVKDLILSKIDIFVKSDDLWTLAPNEIDVDNISEVEPLSEFIRKVISENEGSCNFSLILKFVKQRWITPTIKGNEISKEEINDFVSTTIETNPIFQYDPRNPNNYSLTGVVLPTTPAQNSKKRSSSDSRDVSPDEERTSAPPSPEEGFVCGCGATMPGKTQIAKWRFDSESGTFKCISCFGKHRKYNSKEVFPKKRKEVDNKEQWIQCDRCHKWVSASSDNITDLTVYDDQNPDHLDYFCPKCRVLNKDENKRPKRKGRTSRNSLRSN